MSEAIKNRQQAAENQFALKGEQEFKAKAAAGKLFGLWAAEEMHLESEAANSYSQELLKLSIMNQEHAPIIEHVQHDLLKSGINFSKHKLEAIFLEKLDTSRIKLSK